MNGARRPDLAGVAALFVPELLPERDRALTEQFLALAGQTRKTQVTITRTKETRVELVQEVPATPSRGQHTLPAPLLPLLGRQTELAALLARLRAARLLTLVGAPGIGKTRLALAVGHAARAEFADGAAFVSLAEAQTAADIPYAAVQALSLTPAAGQSPADALRDALRARHLLLSLDNGEHRLDGAPLFADWLAGAPGLKLLCTSRVPLDLYGEHEWPLAPLAVPDLAEPPDRARWSQLPALQLLLARATAADRAFALTDDNLLPLASLCVALDGLPLALELAAVRLRELSPQELVQQLLSLRGHAQLSSSWLGQTRRNVAERHRTLHAAISWSAQLLDPVARQAFYNLGVFAGGCTPEAAQEVAGADAAVLAQLARASLIQPHDGRVRLLETVRAFAREQSADQPATAEAAHAGYFARFAQRVFAGLNGDEQAAWLARAMADHDNCLAALRWALAAGEGDAAVAIAGGLWWFWYRRGYYALGREMLTAALALPSADLADRANALNGLAAFCLIDEDYAANFAAHEQGLALRRQLGDANGVATVLHNMGLTAFFMGDYERAAAQLEESIAISPESDPTSAYAHLGLIAQETHDPATARRWLALAYDGAMRTAAAGRQTLVMCYLADGLRGLGELDEAERLATESLRLFTEMDDSHYRPDAQITLAQIALNRGDTAGAAALTDLAAAQYAARDDAAALASAILVQADIARQEGRRDEGVDLLARSRALRVSVSRAMSPHERAQYDQMAAALGA